ncbi:MAG TPA: substrate-binding domain-containing protein [Baekduia sp.]
MRRTFLGLVTTVAMLAAVVAGTAQADTIRVMSTTDTVDAGLVDGYNGIPGIKALFAQWESANNLPSDTLAYTGVGTGVALDRARNGEADVVITHAPSLEKTFVSQGYSQEAYGRAIFYSDYVIIGPQDDPAGVLSSAPHDAVSAFEKIAQAGAAGKAVFDSRGENSGTNVQEQVIWGLTDPAVVPTQVAANAAGDTSRHEPVTGGTAWYVKTTKGQAANVQQCATTPNCYTMTDRGTFNRLVNSGTLPQLKVVADKNTASDRGGENLLVNPFSAYIVNPSPSGGFPVGAPTPNVPAATRFVDFLTSDFFQNAVNAFPSASDPAFHADAFPKVDATVPTTVTAGQPATLNVTLTDRLPGGDAIYGIAVQLQASTDGGNTFNNVGGPQRTNQSGVASFAPVVASTTTFRVTTARQFKWSPMAQTIGVVAATPAPIVPPKDKTPPTVSKATLSAKKLSLTISEAGKVKATFKIRKTRKVNGKTRTTYVSVKSVTLFAKKAGRISRTFAALKPGTYHVTLTATDKAGNVKTRTVTLVVKAPAKKKTTK